MKRAAHLSYFLLFTFCLGLNNAKADEGMWIAMLLKRMNEGDMQAKGLKLSADEIYAINQSSLKDAVVQFDGGCTGEIIGRDGLLLTNHHCGYDNIQSHSSMQNNYIDNGFWAMNRSQELKNPGTVATFLVRMEDVSQKVQEAIANGKPATERDREAIVQQISKDLAAKAVEGTHYEAFVRPFFYGSEYYLFVNETFKDIRLVGAPPAGIGKFGGDTDNWVWPRHTGDFSLFRIYTGPDGKPAETADNNIPLKPKRFFKLNLTGLKEGDFTMVMGYPGRTQQYLPSYGIEHLLTRSYPYKVGLRTRRLNMLDSAMRANKEV